MKTGLLVEKTLIKNGVVTQHFAAAFQKPNKLTVKYSLTYEGYVTEWTEDREKAARLASGKGL